MVRMEMPSSNEDVDIGSASIILLASPTGVGGVTSTGMFLLIRELLGDRILSKEWSRLGGFADPNCRLSFVKSAFLPLLATPTLPSRPFFLDRRGLLLLLVLGSGCGEIDRAAAEELSTGSLS